MTEDLGMNRRHRPIVQNHLTGRRAAYTEGSRRIVQVDDLWLRVVEAKVEAELRVEEAGRRVVLGDHYQGQVRSARLDLHVTDIG